MCPVAAENICGQSRRCLHGSYGCKDKTWTNATKCHTAYTYRQELNVRVEQALRSISLPFGL